MENWKSIKNYEGLYEVSNLGRVRSLKSDKFLIPRLSKKGYHRVGFWKNNKGKDFYIHRLVAIYFIENPNNLEEVNHKDGDKSNNHFSNLEWYSHKENMSHGYKNGLINNRGSKCATSKLIECDILKIREIYLNSNYTHQSIADKFGVTRECITKILNNKTWTHI
jgi:DNA-binding XRE family transcriptional regulator